MNIRSMAYRGLAACTLLVPAAVMAQTLTATGNLSVTLTLAKSCTVAGGTLTFTNPGGLTANVDNNASFNVRCSTGTSYTLSFSNGTHFGGGTRRMKHGTAADTIDYQIYKEDARTNVLGTSAPGTIGGIGDGLNQAIPVYGRVPPQTMPQPGTYTDTVQITATY